MKVVGIIQARMGSTRLPNKIMMSLGQATVLEYVSKRSRAIRNIDQIIVATTTNSNDDELVEWCQVNDIEVFRGSEDDLLQRYLLCAQKYAADYIVRITGDCPFISIDLAETLIDEVINTKCQYGYVLSSEIPIGLKVSVIETKTLEYMDRVALHPYYREHITLYIDEHLDNFKVLSIVPPDNWQEKKYRLTIDKQEDLLLCRSIVERLGDDILLSTNKIIDLLDMNPSLNEINAEVKQKKYSVQI